MRIINMNVNLLENISKLSLVVLATIIATRILALGFFYFSGKDSQIAQSAVNDQLHHYHLGLILILISFLLYKRKYVKFLGAVGLGILLEEWIVVLKDLGVKTGQIYLTVTDFISVVGIVMLVYIFSKILSIKVKSNRYIS